MGRPKTKKGIGYTHVGAEYTQEETAFLAAVDRYKVQHRKMALTGPEILKVARSLGYRKLDEKILELMALGCPVEEVEFTRSYGPVSQLTNLEALIILAENPPKERIEADRELVIALGWLVRQSTKVVGFWASLLWLELPTLMTIIEEREPVPEYLWDQIRRVFGPGPSEPLLPPERLIDDSQRPDREGEDHSQTRDRTERRRGPGKDPR